ncbi:MAG: hypothetical protein ACRC5H_10185 [Treponemataceae bacterium]
MASCDLDGDDSTPSPTVSPSPTPEPVWEQVGDDINQSSSDHVKNHRSLKLIKDTLYVTYPLEFEVAVKKLENNNNTWQPVGTPFATTVHRESSLNSDTEGTPYIAVKHELKKITVYKWSDEKWNQIGDSITHTDDKARQVTSLRLNFEGDTLFIGYLLYGVARGIYTPIVQSYDSNTNTWTPIADLQISPIIDNNFSMISFKDKIHVAYPSTNSEIIVKDSAGTVVGAPINGKKISNIELFTNNSDLYITYIDDSSVKLYKLTESSWTAISTENITTTTWLSAAIDSKGTIYLALDNSVKKYSNTTWTSVTAPTYSILTVKDDIPYVFGYSNGKLVVEKPIN